MIRDHYRIRYGPPLTVKDRPHREVDTARGRRETPEYDEAGAEQLVLIEAVHAADAVQIAEVTIEEIEECAAVMGTSFSKKDLETLKQYQAFLHGRICTMCGGCIGECPDGVSHNDLLRLLMYHDGYENDRLLRESLETIARQDIQRCSECPSCSVVCRRGLDMKAQIRMVKEIMVRS